MSLNEVAAVKNKSVLDRFKSRQLTFGVLSVLTGLLIWEVFARFILKNPFFLAPPSEVIRVLISLFAGPIYPHLAISSLEFIIGMGLGAVVGIALGVIMALSANARYVLDPWISALYSMPTVALAPLFILWFGIGIWSKVAVVFLVTFVPILVNTSVGIKGADMRLIEATRAFGGSLYHEVRYVRLPWAVPSIIAGLRLAVGRGLVGIVVGELFGAREGIGFLIFDASQRFDSATLLATVIVLSIVGVISVYALEALERRVGGWQGQS
jgi:NitT/TauT family transport system permease protein